MAVRVVFMRPILAAGVRTFSHLHRCLPPQPPLEILASNEEAIAETPLSAVHNLGDLHLDQ